MTVGQSIADPLFIHQLAPTEARKLVLQMLSESAYTPAEYYQRYPADLSGAAAVAIARALITAPNSSSAMSR